MDARPHLRVAFALLPSCLIQTVTKSPPCHTTSRLSPQPVWPCTPRREAFYLVASQPLAEGMHLRVGECVRSLARSWGS
ncbi:hypothetical protein BU16DRAFT_256620 [Lophium mytilinum]|uniref:Secreted protein n=1 Tax=Lophium mytilinum TaxID=390894 RepID=A0A6A6R7Z6_9PEZI|nr:hypothetical protein BU16DRAFT_256620 [Lophium mytilinum]